MIKKIQSKYVQNDHNVRERVQSSPKCLHYTKKNVDDVDCINKAHLVALVMSLLQ